MVGKENKNRNTWNNRAVYHFFLYISLTLQFLYHMKTPPFFSSFSFISFFQLSLFVSLLEAPDGFTIGIKPFCFMCLRLSARDAHLDLITINATFCQRTAEIPSLDFVFKSIARALFFVCRVSRDIEDLRPLIKARHFIVSIVSSAAVLFCLLCMAACVDGIDSLGGDGVVSVTKDMRHVIFPS